MEIAVTGGNGFIGQHLVSKLEQQVDVKVNLFDRFCHSLQDPRSLRSLVRGCDAVFHLAGIVSSSDAQRLYKVNVLGTKHLMQALSQEAPAALLVFPSTFAVYRTPFKDQLISEVSPLEPHSDYGRSKLEAEEIIRNYSDQSKINAVILRLANVYGPGMAPFRHSVVTTFFKQLKDRQPLTVAGDGSQSRDFVFVSDVVDALWAALSLRSSWTINICSGEETSLRDLIKLMSRVTRVIPDIRYVGLPAEGGGFWRGDRTLAQELLNWSPQTDLQTGLILTWKSLW